MAFKRRMAALATCDADGCVVQQQAVHEDWPGASGLADQLRALGWTVGERDERGLVPTLCPAHGTTSIEPRIYIALGEVTPECRDSLVATGLAAAAQHGVAPDRVEVTYCRGAVNVRLLDMRPSIHKDA